MEHPRKATGAFLVRAKMHPCYAVRQCVFGAATYVLGTFVVKTPKRPSETQTANPFQSDSFVALQGRAPKSPTASCSRPTRSGRL